MLSRIQLQISEKLLVLRKCFVFFDEYTGLNEVKRLQNRMVECGNRMTTAQEQHRQVNRELSTTKNKLTEINEKIKTIDSHKNPKLLLKITEGQNEYSNRLEELVMKLDNIEEQERQAVREMRLAIDESHEKERLYTRRTKNINFFLTGLSVLFAFSKFKRDKTVRILADSQVDTAEVIMPKLERIEKAIDKYFAKAQQTVNADLISNLKELRNFVKLEADNTRKDLNQLQKCINGGSVQEQPVDRSYVGLGYTCSILIAVAFLKWFF